MAVVEWSWLGPLKMPYEFIMLDFEQQSHLHHSAFCGNVQLAAPYWSAYYSNRLISY